MPFCTIVEYEWDDTYDRQRFATIIGATDDDKRMPAGCLSRIVGIDDKGARIIEVWRSGDDAQAFAQQSSPSLSGAQLPPPSRVVGFEVTAYLVS